jgi:phosphopantothenoylcysteine decarboxylase/phosphopantothenate--cysteine ligase
MNDAMWNNPIVKKNVATLQGVGFSFVGPGVGWMACRSVGPGRMSESGEIIDAAVEILQNKGSRGKQVPRSKSR